MGETQERRFNYSPAIQASSNGSFGIGTNLTWDAFQRDIYNRMNAALQQQARDLLKRGYVTEAEGRVLSDQRTLILLESRKKLSPFGRLYSEILKPSSDLPTFDKLLADKGSVEAVLESVGRTRVMVNRLSVVMKSAGHAGIAFEVVVSFVVIAGAKPQDRDRVAAGQIGAIGGSALFGWGGAWAGALGGAWAGAASAALLTSPALAIPVVGEGVEAGACLVGGILGGFGLGILGGLGGERAGEAAYDYATRLRWTKP